jgi:hypothetical protein
MSGGSMWDSLECKCCFWIAGGLVPYLTMWLLTLLQFKNSIDTQGKLRLNLHSLSVTELLEYRRKTLTLIVHFKQFVTNLPITFPSSKIGRELRNKVAKFAPNLRTRKRNCQVRNELGTRAFKSDLKSTINKVIHSFMVYVSGFSTRFKSFLYTSTPLAW